MATMKKLHELFIDELRESFAAVRLPAKDLPLLARAARSRALRNAFESDADEIARSHADRLERVFSALSTTVRLAVPNGTARQSEEGQSSLQSHIDESTMNGGLVALAERAEAYEMAVHATLVAWEGVVGDSDAPDLLQETVDEENATDEDLATTPTAKSPA